MQTHCCVKGNVYVHLGFADGLVDIRVYSLYFPLFTYSSEKAKNIKTTFFPLVSFYLGCEKYIKSILNISDYKGGFVISVF